MTKTNGDYDYMETVLRTWMLKWGWKKSSVTETDKFTETWDACKTIL